MKQSFVITSGFRKAFINIKDALKTLLPELLGGLGIKADELAHVTKVVSGTGITRHTGGGFQNYDIAPDRLYLFGDVDGSVRVDEETNEDATLDIYLTKASTTDALTYRGRFTLKSLDSNDSFAVNITPATGGESVTIAGSEPTYEVDHDYEFVIYHNVCTITDITAGA